MNNFLKRFNELSNNKYDYLRIKSVVSNDDYTKVVITFYIPYEIFKNNEKFSDEDKSYVYSICNQIVPKEINLSVEYDFIQISPEVIVRFINAFIRKNYYKALEDRYDSKNISVQIKDKIIISIPVDSTIYSYCLNKGIKENIENYLNSKFLLRSEINFKQINISHELKEKRLIKNKYIDDGIVVMQKLQKIVGEQSNISPKYIAKLTKPLDPISICGKVISLEKKVSKAERVFFSFIVEDPTGSKKCLFFPRKKRTKDPQKSFSSQFDNVQIGDELYLTGSLIQDTLNKTKNTFFAKSIYYCKIDYEATLNKIQYMRDQKAKTIPPVPQEYSMQSSAKQLSIFETQEYIAPILRNHDFVVFDLETTGLDENARIVEIGACKVVNGKIISTFSTLIDPQIPMPLEAQAVNNISDDMLKTAPYFEYVIGAFMDYCKGCIVVGHNARRFDVPVMQRKAKEMGYDFNFDCLDTMELFRQCFPNSKKANLAYCLDMFKLKNNEAHRALTDTLATAELFIKLVNQLKLD